MSNNNANAYERLFKLQAAVGKLVLDGRRYPEDVADALQKIVDDDTPVITDGDNLALWSHPRQKTDRIDGHYICADLRFTCMLDSCARLRDLEEIRKKGIIFFRTHFEKGQRIFAWKSIKEDGNRHAYVPYIGDAGDVIYSGSQGLGDNFDANCMTLLLKTQSPK